MGISMVRARKNLKYIAFPIVVAAYMGILPAQAGAPNTGTDILTGRTEASYVKGRYGYVTLSGTVSRILDNDRFILDYGNGVTQVNYDDALHDLFKKTKRTIKTDDKVTVIGKIDNKWFTSREILASSIIYISDDYMLIYKPPGVAGDELPAIVGTIDPSLLEDGRVALTGIVSGVAYKGSFTLRYEEGTIQVDAFGVKIPDTNQIVSGDVVTVYGKIDNSFFRSRTLTAETVEKIGIFSRVLPASQ